MVLDLRAECATRWNCPEVLSACVKQRDDLAAYCTAVAKAVARMADPSSPTLALVAQADHFSDDGRVFGTPALRPPSGQPTHYVHLTKPSDPDCLTLFFASESLVAVCSSHPLLNKPLPPPRA